MVQKIIPITVLTLGVVFLVGWGTSNNATTASPVSSSTQLSQNPSPNGEPAVAPEKNPPGDIPDTQAFVAYTSQAGGYQLEVPEGWARQINGANVSFIDKFNGVQVTVTNSIAAPTAKTTKTTQIPELEKTSRSVKVVNVKDVQLPSGKGVVIAYTSNSQPNQVTGKQIRLENNSYLFFKNGKLATLRLFAPQGADNVDQWQRISRSFKSL